MALTAQLQNRIDRAVAKAIEQSQAGNRPTLLGQWESGLETRQKWAVGSRTQAGVVYLVELAAGADGLETHCTCAAAEADRICWHRAIVRGSALVALECTSKDPAVQQRILAQLVHSEELAAGILRSDSKDAVKTAKDAKATAPNFVELPEDDVHVGPSDYVPWLTDRKWAHIRLEGEAFGVVELERL